MDIPIFIPEHRWSCPNCTTQSVTRKTGPHTEFHHCAGLAGLWAPMVEDGIKAKVEAVEREDYIDGEDIRYDGNGRPIMSVVTTRDDGQDCAAYAATALGGARSE
jgi:hypothetical protein